jgi:peptidyl-prolyl cis-trans isomerase A (cyclophilin A)
MVLSFTLHVPTDWLDNKHCFWKGQDIVDAVTQGDVLESLEIIREVRG